MRLLLAVHICALSVQCTIHLLYRQKKMSEPTQYITAIDTQDTRFQTERRSWIVGLTSLLFIVLQSACTAVMAISGVRVLIGLGALAAAAGLHIPATGFHSNAIRIPMMVLAVGGSIVNLYVIWRIRSLRGRTSSQWRTQTISTKKIQAERLQITIAVVTLILVAAEYATHLLVHNV